MAATRIEEVLQEHVRQWMAIPGVVGTAIGLLNGQPCIKVFVAEKTDKLAAKIPSAVEGYRVVLEESGEFRAL